MLLADDALMDVTYDPARGYVATHSDLPQPVLALSLAALRARVGRQLGIAAGGVHLKLDRAARRQRDERRGGAERATDTRPV